MDVAHQHFHIKHVIRLHQASSHHNKLNTSNQYTRYVEASEDSRAKEEMDLTRAIAADVCIQLAFRRENLFSSALAMHRAQKRTIAVRMKFQNITQNIISHGLVCIALYPFTTSFDNDVKQALSLFA